MAKVAKLVYVSLMTRVIVEDTDSEHDVIETARGKFHAIINSSLHENVEEVIDDIEVPYSEDDEQI